MNLLQNIAKKHGFSRCNSRFCVFGRSHAANGTVPIVTVNNQRRGTARGEVTAKEVETVAELRQQRLQRQRQRQVLLELLELLLLLQEPEEAQAEVEETTATEQEAEAQRVS